MDDKLVFYVIGALFFIPVPLYIVLITAVTIIKEIILMGNLYRDIFFSFLYLLCLFLILSVVFSIKPVDLIVYNPFLPFILHFACTIFYFNKALKIIEVKFHRVLSQRMNTNLILTGFCFTSLSFLFCIVKNDITIYKYPFLYFIIALGFFLVSYFSLHFKIANLFEYLSEASTDSGLWCILLGLYHLFRIWKAMELINWAIIVLMSIFIGYLILNFIMTIIEERGRRGK